MCFYVRYMIFEFVIIPMMWLMCEVHNVIVYTMVYSEFNSWNKNVNNTSVFASAYEST